MAIKFRYSIPKRHILLIEFFTLYLLLPAIYVIFDLDTLIKEIFQNRWILLYHLHKVILLQIIFLYTLLVYAWKIKNYHYFKFNNFLNHWFYLKTIFKRLMIITVILFIYTYYFYPNFLFQAIKLNKFYVIILVLFFYPLISVIQQEFIYRIFFYERYNGFFSNKKEFYLTNSFLFMFVHIIYQNWFALFATFIGNFLFLSTFFRTKSFYFIFIEHSFYGLSIFFVGLGNFFYQTHTLKIF